MQKACEVASSHRGTMTKQRANTQLPLLHPTVRILREELLGAWTALRIELSCLQQPAQATPTLHQLHQPHR